MSEALILASWMGKYGTWGRDVPLTSLARLASVERDPGVSREALLGPYVRERANVR